MEELDPEVHQGIRLRNYVCSLCHGFQSYHFLEVYRHIKDTHSFSPQFNVVCGLDSCQARFKSAQSWRRHLTKCHIRTHQPTILQQSISIPENDESETPMLMDTHDQLQEIDLLRPTQPMSLVDMQKEAAKFIMKTRDSGFCTQVFLDKLLVDVTSLQEKVVSRIQQKMLQAMEQASQDPQSLKEAASSAVLDSRNYDIFRELGTEHRQNTYIKEMFALIEPKERILAHSYNGSREVFECCYDVSLLESIQAMLKCEVVRKSVLNPHKQCTRVLVDYNDGIDVSNHPIFCSEPTALQVILYCDDMEVTNPLGSSAGVHKLCLFYFTLGNLEPRLRSTVQAIQLVAVVRTKCFENGCTTNDILKPFMDDLKKLESDEGVLFSVGGQRRRLRGSLVAFCGDNLASQQVGGFINLSSANRRCRHCLATKQEIQDKFTAEEFTQRTEGGHSLCLQRLREGILTSNHLETTYGVRRDSILNSLQHFHVVKDLPPDVMHDVLEGAVPVEISCMLQAFVKEQKLFTLQQINNRMEGFKWGPDATDHPPQKLNKVVIDDPMNSSLKLGAAEAWTFARLLPILIGDLVPEGNVYWKNFLRLLDILDIVLAPKITPGHISFLRELIEEHHKAFRELYPHRPLTPKMHYMVHIPSFMKRFGPMRTMWTMRFEGKHHYFKKMARALGNFKNIAKSMAYRHQRHMCFLQSSPDGYLQDSLDTGRVENIIVGAMDIQQDVTTYAPLLRAPGSIVQRTKWLEYRGIKYNERNIVAARATMDDPEFAVILSILLPTGSNPLLVLDLMETEGYNNHYHAYSVKFPMRRQKIVLDVQELLDHCVLGNYQPFNSVTNFVYVKYKLLDSLELSAPKIS